MKKKDKPQTGRCVVCGKKTTIKVAGSYICAKHKKQMWDTK